MKSPNILLSIVAAVTMTFGVSTSSVHAQCASDITGDGQINGADLSQLLADWGSCPGVITSVTPLQGSVLGGTQITINGTSLSGTTAVKIGGVACTNLQVLSPTLVKAVTPAGVAGEASIAVVSAAGTTLAPTPFTYVQLSISSVSPNQGIYSGGTAITITGTFLNGATSVKVGGVPATDVVAVNSTTVTAVTPAGSLGAASVEVTGAKGTATASGAFTYELGSIVSIVPIAGVVGGGALITISGSYLSGATSVTIGGAPATNLVVVSPTTITAVTPTGTLGPADVVVTTPAGTLTLANGFTYRTTVVPSWATLLELLPDPSVVNIPTLHAAIAASGFAWRIRDNASNIEMLLVPAGIFTMGCSPGDAECGSDESPVHQVTLTNAFYMGKTEVTQAQWLAKMGNNPSYFSGYSDSPSRPVERVSWELIAAAGGFNSVTGLRLPTEAEWEYACRAGTTSAQYGSVNGVAWYSNAGWTTHPVAQKSPNSLGLYDTLGNVWEWCEDWDGTYSSESVTNPTGPAIGSYRLLRGGSWNNESSYSRASSRWHTNDHADSPFGFRVVRNP